MDWCESHLLCFFEATKSESVSPFRIISETKNRPPFHGRICIMQAFYEVDSSVLTEIFG